MKSGLPRPQALLLVLAGLLLAAPFIAVFLLGLLWLYQHDRLLLWMGLTAGATGLVWVAAWWVRRGVTAEWREQAEQPVRPPEPDWAPLEQAAWAEVARLSENVTDECITDRDRLLQVAEETLRRVAAHYHPAQEDPLWEFTLPEALLLSERISARLRKLLLEEVPLSHRIRVGRVLRLWGYKPVVSSGLAYGRQAWRAYRLARLANPLHALAAELRELFMQELSSSARAYLLRRLGRIWVEEVGRAAIELYSGRLQRDADALARLAEQESDDGHADRPLPGVPRVLVVGQPQVGKSSLVNALLGEPLAGADALPLTAGQTGYRLQREGVAPVLLVDTPGLGTGWAQEALVDAAAGADLVLWVCAAHRADRGVDRAALDSVRGWFEAHPERRRPPVRVVASHVDRLSPKREWQPPYDLDPLEERPKARRIDAAVGAIADDLAVERGQVIPLSLRGDAPWNLERLVSEVAGLLPAMEQTRRVRLARQPMGGWRQVAGQLGRGGQRLWRGLRRR